MEEIIRPRRTTDGSGPSGLGDPLAPGDGGDAYVVSGPYAEQLPVGGLSVRHIRNRYGDRFDLDPHSQAILDGNPADEDTVVEPGQMLMFIRRAGEKGSDKITITEDQVQAVSPEGQTTSLPLSRLVNLLNPPRLDTGAAILPDGVKSILTRWPVAIWVHETPPRVYNLKWIAEDSPAHYGRGTKYRSVRIALPYLVVLAVFHTPREGPPRLSQANECFFRTAPLRSLDDKLLYPALLNCSKFDPPDGKPLSWICTQHLEITRRRHFQKIGPDHQVNFNQQIRRDLEALLHCLLETGFNYSSDHHEASSWFSESTGRDERIATIERWEQETVQDPNFVLDIPWIEVGMSLGEVVDRISKNCCGDRIRIDTASDLARLIFNSNGQPRRRWLQQSLLEFLT